MSRFYGVDVPREIEAAASEMLTRSEYSDLVDRHLAINYGYFGAIDKTLAGFVVLDDTGDDYVLYDARDSKQLFFQEHEERIVYRTFDSLADKRAAADAIARANAEADDEDHVDAREIERSFHATTSRGTRRLATPALLDRYQWLVWILAQPLRSNGVPTQTADDLVRNGIGRFRRIWPRREEHDAVLEAELPELAGDPHLAIYWILHTTMIGDDAARARVLAAIGPPTNELVRAFVSRVGSLGVADDLPIVPDFRTRRSLALTYGAFVDNPDQGHTVLRALETEPHTKSLANASIVIDHLGKGALSDEEVAATLARIESAASGAGSVSGADSVSSAAAASGVSLLRAVLDKRAGATKSVHADAVARVVPASTDPWWLQLEALWHTHELAKDTPALASATSHVLAHDRFHKRAITMAIRARGLVGQPTSTLEAELAVAERALEPYAELVKPGPDVTAVTRSLDEPTAHAVAWRVLQRAQLNKPTSDVAAWAIGVVIRGGDPRRGEIIGPALAGLDARTLDQVLADVKAELAKADQPGEHPLLDVLFELLDGPEAPEEDFGAYLQIEHGKEAALKTLAPWVHLPAVFERVMERAERPLGRTFMDPLWNKLFSPFQKESYVADKLDGAQAVRVAKAMIRCILTHPQIHARSAAGHQLFRFSHPGAEELLISALQEYGERYADFEGDGTPMDHGGSERKQLEDIVANLYAAIRGLETPRSRTAILERLFVERRSIWRLCNAISDIFTPELHAQALELLAARKHRTAAGLYAHSLRSHVKQTPPLVDLGRLIVEWPATGNAHSRGTFKYALIVCEKAALDAKEYDLVRALHAAVAAIAEPVEEPDHRGTAFANPLEEATTAAALAKVLSGDADKAKAKLVAAASEGRATGKRNLKISDAQLGVLAGSSVASRWMHDPATGEILFVDAEGRMRFFDGYSIDASFTTHRVELKGMAEHLGDVSSKKAFDERAQWWTSNGSQFREASRIGSRVILYSGPNNGLSSRHVVELDDEPRAAALMQQLRAHPPKGFVASDPFYLVGKGAIERTYYVPLPDGKYNDEREHLWVLDGLCGSGNDLGSDAAAIAEHEAREVRFLAAGGTLLTIEHRERLRRAMDKTVAEWLDDRARDDSRDPIWHLRALSDMAAYLADHDLAIGRLASLDVQLGPPATDEDIDALAAQRSHPIPESLRTLWRAHGRASWHADRADFSARDPDVHVAFGEMGMRLLGPREVLARREVARALGNAYLFGLTPDRAQQARALFEHLDVIVETHDGKPVTLLADIEREDGRVFSHAYDNADDMWWEVSLSWMLATRLVGEMAALLVARAPILTRLMYGQRRNPKEKLAYLEKGALFFELALDPATSILSTRFGKIGSKGTANVSRLDPVSAATQFARKLAEKKKAGYVSRAENKSAAKAKKLAKAKQAAAKTRQAVAKARQAAAKTKKAIAKTKRAAKPRPKPKPKPKAKPKR